MEKKRIPDVKDTSQPPVTVLDGGKTRLYDVIQLVEFYQLNARVLPTSAGNETAFWSRRFILQVKDTSQPPVTVLDGGKTRLYDVIQLVEFYQLNAGVLPTSAGNEAAFWSRRFILQVKDTSQPPVTVLDGDKTRLYDVIQLVEFYQLNARVLPTSAGNETAFWSRRFILQVKDTSQPPVTVLDGGKTRLYDVIQLVEFYQLNAGVLPSAHPSHLLHHAHRAVVVIGAPSRRAELLTAAAPPPAPPAAEARDCSS
ncbi:uncharacterized protein LOC122385151 [Amphibalanus amphitrite]|uniref:uncharacterized protein LOC122385151 n=1 Tax=Amphibalanus amphitrite TaxID=1232801 RepID=UPI001C91DCB9|nr:uncharacterized protein LOC122385151 [Amphibalanus amphitrite]